MQKIEEIYKRFKDFKMFLIKKIMKQSRLKNN